MNPLLVRDMQKHSLGYMETKMLFKVGDIVRARKDNGLYSFAGYGENVFTIEKIERYDNGNFLHIISVSGDRDWWSESRFELVKPKKILSKQELICEKIVEMQNRRKALGYKF